MASVPLQLQRPCTHPKRVQPWRWKSTCAFHSSRRLIPRGSLNRDFHWSSIKSCPPLRCYLIPSWWLLHVWLRIPIRVFSMSSRWRAVNHDTSGTSTLNMCNAILKIYQQLQYLPNPSHPIASPWKPYETRPISELQATPKWTVHHFFCFIAESFEALASS